MAGSAVGTTLVLVSPMEATGILLGVSTLAPVFILPLTKPNVPEGSSDEGFRRLKYSTSTTYATSSVALLVQFAYFVFGASQDNPWYTYTLLDLGVFFFLAAVILTLFLTLSIENPYGGWLLTVFRTGVTFAIGYLYAVRLTFLISLDYPYRSPLVLALSAGGISFIAYMLTSLRRPSWWHHLLWAISLLIVVASFYLLPQSLLLS